MGNKKHLENYEDECDIFLDLEELQNKVNKTNNINKNNNKSSFFKKVKNRKQIVQKNDGEFINLGDDTITDQEDFVIVGEKNNKFKKFLNHIKIIFVIALLISLTVFIYLSMSFKIITKNVMGSDYSIKSINFISRNYQPNLDELKVGDILICEYPKLKWSPIVLNYKEYKYKNRNFGRIFVTDSEGKVREIEAVDISYIRR